MKKISVLWVAILLLWSCNKNITKKKTSGKANVKSIYEEVLKNDCEFQTVKIKGSGVFKQGKNHTKFSYRIHIEHNKKIWASVSGFGIEALRVLIENDSAAFINRLEHKYWKGNVNELAQNLGLQANFSVLENIIIGNFVQRSQKPFSDQTNRFLLNSELQGIPLAILVNEQYKTESIHIIDKEKGWDSQLKYENFQIIAGRIMPFKMHLNVTQPKETQAHLEHKEIEFNPAEIKFTFQIPADYQLMKL